MGANVRLLHFADLHLDTPFRWAGPELARARRQALRQTLQGICRFARDQQVDALTCAGDLYEQDRFTPDTAEFLRTTFADLDPIRVFISPGNHDWYGPSSLYRQVEWSPNVHIFDRPELAPFPLVDGLTLWGAAHCAPANTPGFLDTFRVDRGGRHLGIFHGSERGGLHFQEEGKIPHSPFRADQIAQAGLHHALVGHFHSPADAATHTYPGNPDPLAFGEGGDRGAVLVTVSDSGEITRQRYIVATSTVNDIPLDLTGVTHAGQVEERVRDALATLSGVVRVTLSGEVGPDVDLRVDDIATIRPANIDALVPRLGRISVAYDYDRLAEEPTVRGQFVRDVRADPNLPDDQRRRVLITGLRALDGRRDELEVR